MEIISPKPADLSAAGASARIFVSPMMTSGHLAGYVILKFPFTMGAE